MAGLRPGDCDWAVEETQPRDHGEEQDQGGALHDQQELASRDVHNQEAVQTTSLISKIALYEYFCQEILICLL